MLIWLPSVLKAAGLKVAPVPGWDTRGRGDMGKIYGVMCHHTVGATSGNMPSLDTLINGRPAHDGKPALPGPLANLGLGRDGTYYVVAAGKCNHAGEGIWNGIHTGNSSFIGIEGENTGLGEPWPDVQMDAYHRGAAALLMYSGCNASNCIGHKEYAPKRKPNDPSFDMAQFRLSVAAIINGSAPPPSLIPASENPDLTNGSPGRPTLRRGSSGKFVAQIQSKLKINHTGNFDALTEATVREFQRIQNLVPDGIVGPKTWRRIDAIV
jgi:hypothetical protein